MIAVKVGNGPTVHVLLDTGSVGLHIYAPGVKTGAGGGVTVTHRADSITYAIGAHQTGVVAEAKVTIGGITTTRAIQFGLITSLSCVPGKPNCPGREGVRGELAAGVYGTMGVRLDQVPPGVPANPLLALPSPYSRSWSVAMASGGGRLVLGAHVPSTPTAALPLLAQGLANLCWTLGAVARCAPTVIDSGTASMEIYGGPLSEVPTVPGTSLVKPGTPVSARTAVRGRPFWRFAAGRVTSKNAVLQAPLGREVVNASIEAFYAFTVTFDAARRTISLSAPS
jgi:hypothetical protein